MNNQSIFLILTATLLPIHAEVKCPPVFGSHMVLQRDQSIPVWGTASPGEKVTVEFAKSKLQADAGKDGVWQVKLPRLPRARNPGRLW